MRCLVTGGAGFIELHLVKQPVHEVHEVMVLDNLAMGLEGNLAGVRDQLSFVDGDLRDANDVRNCVTDRDVRDSRADVHAAFQAFGYAPLVGFQDGLPVTVGALMDQFASAVSGH
jgi:nucleoside-diphosphate-sugar epimerase